jgi:hypothetical protein
VAVLVDFRPTGKLRGTKPLDVIAALGPVVDALAEDSVSATSSTSGRSWQPTATSRS